MKNISQVMYRYHRATGVARNAKLEPQPGDLLRVRSLGQVRDVTGRDGDRVTYTMCWRSYSVPLEEWRRFSNVAEVIYLGDGCRHE